MLRRILLALADDATSKAASVVALDLAHQFQASVTSLATVDLAGASLAAVAPGIGATYYAYDVLRDLESALMSQAKERCLAFISDAKKANVEHREMVEEGTPWEIFEWESFSHDILIAGHHAHFSFASRPDQPGPGKTLRKLLDHAACPLLAVSQAPLDLGKVLVALDGRPASVRALQAFVHLGLGPEAQYLLFHCEEGLMSAKEILDPMCKYLESHRKKVSTLVTKGPVKQEVLRAAQKEGVGLVVMGAHGRTRLAEWVLGNTAKEMLAEANLSVCVAH